jgi:hypothetical protein
VKQEDELRDTFDMYLKCLEVLEENYAEEGYFDKEINDYEDNTDANIDNYDSTTDSTYDY